jgi:nicotinate-nucleotide adenylyltransferase
MSNDIKDLQDKINKVYTSIFGRTPLQQRLQDITKESYELTRFLDMQSLKEEGGDLLTTLIQLFNECGWNINDLVEENLQKIKKRKRQYKALGRKIQVAILGGAFNPITLGHIQVARLVLNHSRIFDEVWIMPCFKHLYGKDLVSAEHRLEMCRLAAQVDGRIKVFDYEVTKELDGETYNLAKTLFEDKRYKHSHSFSFVIGLDNANTFDKWVNYQELERLARFVVIPRTGEKIKRGVNWYLKPPHVFLEPDDPLMEISSTEVRVDLTSLYMNSSKEKIQQELLNDPTKAYNRGLNQDVLGYILKHRLYQWKSMHI